MLKTARPHRKDLGLAGSPAGVGLAVLVGLCAASSAAAFSPAALPLGLGSRQRVGGLRTCMQSRDQKHRPEEGGGGDAGFNRRAALWAGLALGVGAPLAASADPAAKAQGSRELRTISGVDFNSLDEASAEALLRDSKAAAEAIKGSAVFSFRGDKLLKTNPQGALKYIARRNAVFLGERHNSLQDKQLAKNILVELGKLKGRDLAVGLEMVQMPFQGALDWYVYKAPISKLSDKLLFEMTEWGTRWGWQFELYLPVLRYCQLKKIRMLALNVEAEATEKVRNNGLTSLTKEERARLIIDPKGFVDDTLSASFPAYADAVLKPSFQAHVQMGIFSDDEETYKNFVSNRVLWDEAMASSASKYLASHPEKLLVGLVGGDHIKTGHGIPSRIERILHNIGLEGTRTTSVALNPSWKLYSDSKTLVELKNLEKSVKQQESKTPTDSPSEFPGMLVDAGAQESGSAEETGASGGRGWLSPPPADHHPFSDIVWFST